jgi:hypothetical protein
VMPYLYGYSHFSKMGCASAHAGGSLPCRVQH